MQEPLHILCIDDEEMIRETISDYLSDEGYRVITASNGREGLEKFFQFKPDIVLVDLRMPFVDGLEVLEKVVSTDREIPIIVISGTGDMRDVIEAMRLGAWDYLTKPIGNMEILQVAVQKSYEKSQLLRENRLYRENLELMVRRRTDELQESEARFRRLVDNARDIIARISLVDLSFEYVSPVVEEISGYGPEEFLENIKFFYSVVADEFRPGIEEFFGNAKKGMVPVSIEYQIKNRDGSLRWILQRNVLVFDDEQRAVALEVIAGDISLRKKEEEEREMLIQDLETKNAELERFTYTVSHDLRSPLVTIKGFIGMLRDDLETGNTENVHADLERISGAADKMNHLLSDLLELSRIGRIINESSWASLNDILDTAREMLHGSIADRRVVFRIPDGLPDVYGDIPRIEEVVQNLIENSLKFFGSRVNPEITVNAEKSGNNVVITFTDNGIGIAPEYHEQIFGLFNKLDKNAEGTGVGLALIKRIVEVHGGEIRVESAEGEGAAFIFTLPLPEKF